MTDGNSFHLRHSWPFNSVSRKTVLVPQYYKNGTWKRPFNKKIYIYKDSNILSVLYNSIEDQIERLFDFANSIWTLNIQWRSKNFRDTPIWEHHFFKVHVAKHLWKQMYHRDIKQLFLPLYFLFCFYERLATPGYEGISDPNILSEQNVWHQKNVLYCSDFWQNT